MFERFSSPAPLPPASCVCKVMGSVRERYMNDVFQGS